MVAKLDWMYFGLITMDKEKERKAKERFEILKDKSDNEKDQTKTPLNDREEEIPREAFRKNLGCG